MNRLIPSKREESQVRHAVQVRPRVDRLDVNKELTWKTRLIIYRGLTAIENSVIAREITFPREAKLSDVRAVVSARSPILDRTLGFARNKNKSVAYSGASFHQEVFTRG